MNEDVTISEYIQTAVACTIAYCIPAVIFFRTHAMLDSWILYIGNITFIVVLSVATYFIHKRLHDETKMGKMIAVGMKLTIVSTLFTMLVIIALYYFFGSYKIPLNPSYITANSMLNILFLSVIVVNIFIGFIAVTLVAIVYNQIPKNINGDDVT
jgi:hypothetical protein